MSKIDNGGSAFPTAMAEGLSLRDYFAAKAMQAFLSGGHDPGEGHWYVEADAAYEVADAMLNARGE